MSEMGGRLSMGECVADKQRVAQSQTNPSPLRSLGSVVPSAAEADSGTLLVKLPPHTAVLTALSKPLPVDSM